MRESRISVRGPDHGVLGDHRRSSQDGPRLDAGVLPISTPRSIVVVAGSTIVTPLRMCISAICWRSSRSVAASLSDR